jgi:hypothetical protein
MKFDLDCFVLTQVRADSPEDESPSVAIRGFYHSPEAALLGLPELKVKLARQWIAGINSFFGVQNFYDEDSYKAGSFFVLTLTGAEFHDLFQVEDAIEKSALSAWRNRKPLPAAPTTQTAEMAQ